MSHEWARKVASLDQHRGDRGRCVNTEWTTLAAPILSSRFRGQEPLLELDAVRTGGRGARLPLL